MLDARARYESFRMGRKGPAARLSSPLRGILDDLAISIETGEWKRRFRPTAYRAEKIRRGKRTREREGGGRERGRLDASPGPAFPAPGQVNPLSSNIETNYRSPALVIIRLQINAFKLSAFEINCARLLARTRICGRDYASFRFPSFFSPSLL